MIDNINLMKKNIYINDRLFKSRTRADQHKCLPHPA